MKITKKQLQEMIQKEARKQLEEQQSPFIDGDERYDKLDELVQLDSALSATIKELNGLPDEHVQNMSKKYMNRVTKIVKTLRQMTKLVDDYLY